MKFSDETRRKMSEAAKNRPFKANAHRIEGDTVFIEMRGRKYYAEAIVDLADYSLVANLHWHVYREGNQIYAGTWLVIEGHRQHEVMHRLLTGRSSTQIVDHEDRNGLNNRRANIRWATRVQNGQNQIGRRNRKRPYKGVDRCVTTGRWKARIIVNKKETWLGRYDSAEEAARAYDAAALKYFGEFACLNFPVEVPR